MLARFYTIGMNVNYITVKEISKTSTEKNISGTSM